MRFSPLFCMSTTCLYRLLAMNGPFLIERDTPVPLFPSLHDEAAGDVALLAGLVALGRLAPRRDGVPAALGLALAAAVRVVDGVHGSSSHLRPAVQPPAAARLAERHVHVVLVAQLAEGGIAAPVDEAHLA